MRGRLTMLYVAYLVVLPGPLRSEEPLDARVAELARPLIEARVADGLAIGLIESGKRHVVGLGRVHRDRDALPDGATVYEIGSVTKVFTALLLAELVQRGEVSLEDPVQGLLPATVTVPKWGDRPITLLDLATHTSALPRLPGNMAPADSANPYADYDAAKLYAFLNGYQLPRAPGERVDYSNLGAGLLGHALALRFGCDYERSLREVVLNPLGMRDTMIKLDDEHKERLAPGHDADGRAVSNWDLDVLAGAGALRSTVDDMLTFLEANLAPESTPLAEALEATHTPRFPLGQDAGQIGLGWHVLPDGATYWHNGGTGGYRSLIGFEPRRKLAVVVLCNTSTELVDRLAMSLVALLAGKPVEPLVVRAAVPVEAAILQQYVGTYELAPTFRLVITLEEDSLFVQATNQPKFRLYPASETEFFLRVVNAQVRFVRNDKDAANELILEQNGIAQSARRVEP